VAAPAAQQEHSRQALADGLRVGGQALVGEGVALGEGHYRRDVAQPGAQLLDQGFGAVLPRDDSQQGPVAGPGQGGQHRRLGGVGQSDGEARGGAAQRLPQPRQGRGSLYLR